MAGFRSGSRLISGRPWPRLPVRGVENRPSGAGADGDAVAEVIRTTASNRVDNQLFRAAVAIAAATAIGTPTGRFRGSGSRRSQVARVQGRPLIRRARTHRRHDWCEATVSTVI